MRKSLKQFIYEQLVKDGVNPAYIGFDYFISSCQFLIDTGVRSKHFAITKELYPAIADLHNVTPQSVEKNMRYALKSAGIAKVNYRYIRELIYLIEFAGY